MVAKRNLRRDDRKRAKPLRQAAETAPISAAHRRAVQSCLQLQRQLDVAHLACRAAMRCVEISDPQSDAARAARQALRAVVAVEAPAADGNRDLTQAEMIRQGAAEEQQRAAFVAKLIAKKQRSERHWCTSCGHVVMGPTPAEMAVTMLEELRLRQLRYVHSIRYIARSGDWLRYELLTTPELCELEARWLLDRRVRTINALQADKITRPRGK